MASINTQPSSQEGRKEGRTPFRNGPNWPAAGAGWLAGRANNTLFGREERKKERKELVSFFLSFCYVCVHVYTVYTVYTLHYTTLHYTTLHYTTLHYTTLHYAARARARARLTFRGESSSRPRVDASGGLWPCKPRRKSPRRSSRSSGSSPSSLFSPGF